jgi:DNA (cytosine-5)-methyltransferase 1
LVNPQYGNNGNSIHKPAPTVIATQKSRPLSLASSISGKKNEPKIEEIDSPAMQELKAFMIQHRISDIYMRMLKVIELKRIQGFPDDYILCGPSDKQKKFIGNSVETNVVSAWIKAIHSESFNKISTHF